MAETSKPDLDPATSPSGIPAATVVIFRNKADSAPELLMLQRSLEMRFAGGAVVFPGGKVDPQDQVLAARLCPEDDPVIGSARIAAIRETLEEAGLAIALREKASPDQVAAARRMLLEGGLLAPVLERFGWTLEPERLTLFAHWLGSRDRGFDTRFFVYDLGTGAVEIAVDATENTRLFWCTAAQALERADAGELKVIFPTRRNLERLAQFHNFAEALQHIALHPVRLVLPRQIERDGERWLQIPEGYGYPVTEELLSTVKRG